MYTKINGETYEVSTKLGVAYELEKMFNKKISEIASGINDFDIKNTLRVFYVGFKKTNPEVTEKAFEEMFLEGEDIGFVDLKKEVIIFLTLMMSKNKTEEKVREELEEKFNASVEKAEADAEAEKELKN